MLYDLKISLNITLIESLGPCYFRLGVGTISVLHINAVASCLIGGRRKVAGSSQKTPVAQGEKKVVSDKKTPTFVTADLRSRRAVFLGQEDVALPFVVVGIRGKVTLIQNGAPPIHV